MHELLIEDLGPDFYGMRAKAGEKIVCMATPRVEHDAKARGIVRGLIERQGGDCARCQNCLNCLIGRHEQ